MKMKNKLKIWAGCGILCVLSVLLASWYAVTFNDSRLVVPMEAANFEFQTKDLPMIISIALTCIYLFALLITLFIYAMKKQKQVKETGVTRRINPALGFLGMFGFMGFIGFYTYAVNGAIFPFAYFLFFGFFSFFYEGKMSGTFMDERFRENMIRAKLNAYRTTVTIMFAALLILCQGKLFGSLEYTLIATVIALSLALAIGLFLSEYLLYRYDHDDQTLEGEE